MPRPRKYRFIQGEFGIGYFGPKGIPMSEMEQVVLSQEEVEALRLVDLGGMYHEQAAEIMGVSRPTFGRVLQSARSKLTDALINGKSVRVEGGSYMIGARHSGCRYWKGQGRNRWRRRGQL
ncbi:DUF134 domain-containing protein [candidate division WOR-3 bacterium]|nr:DUF134 domain-containing protein [candidate division WOR-3 bacterium]